MHVRNKMIRQMPKGGLYKQKGKMMDTQQTNHDRAYKENTDKNHIDEMFPKGPLGPILGAPKQYEPPYRDQSRSCDGDRFKSNGLVVKDDETNKAA